MHKSKEWDKSVAEKSQPNFKISSKEMHKSKVWDKSVAEKSQTNFKSFLKRNA